MDCTEIRFEMAEEGLLEPLVITEEADIRSCTAFTVQSCCGETALIKEEEQSGGDVNDENKAGEMCLQEPNLEKQQANTEGNQTGEVVDEEDKPEETLNTSDGQSRVDSESIEEADEVTKINEKPEKPLDTEEKDFRKINFSEQQCGETQSHEEDPKKVCKLLF